MKIGIDIDGVITDSHKFKIKYGIKFANDNNIKYSLDINQHESYNLFSWSEETDKRFWNQYYLKYATSSDYIRNGAAYVISQLIKSGDKIFIVTGREDNDLRRIGLPFSMEKLTKQWLKDNKIYYHKLAIAITKKYEYSVKNNIDIFIDDLPYFIEMFPKNYPCVCFDCSYNQNICIDKNKRAYNWDDVLKIINKIKRGE